MIYDANIHRARLIELCKERVEKNGVAYIRQVSHDYSSELGGDVGYEEAEIVANIICKEDKRYIYDEAAQYFPRLKHNPNYILEESMKAANLNSIESSERSLNIGNKSNLLAGVTGLFILGSVITSIWQINSSEKLKPIFQQMDTTLQNQRRELDSLKQTQRTVSSRLQAILDSLSKKP